MKLEGAVILHIANHLCLIPKPISVYSYSQIHLDSYLNISWEKHIPCTGTSFLPQMMTLHSQSKIALPFLIAMSHLAVIANYVAQLTLRFFKHRRLTRFFFPVSLNVCISDLCLHALISISRPIYFWICSFLFLHSLFWYMQALICIRKK